jgi:hypothetical protein
MLGTPFELILIFNVWSALQNHLFGALAKLRKATICFFMFVCPCLHLSVRVSFCLSLSPSVCPCLLLSVRMAQLGSEWTDFPEIWYLSIFRNSVEKSLIALKCDENNGKFTWTLIYIFKLYIAQFFLESEMFQTRVVEKLKTHNLCPKTFFENRVFYEIMWKNIVEPDKPQMTICRMSISCYITEATDTHSEYVILHASPLQQWLQERASVFRCM